MHYQIILSDGVQWTRSADELQCVFSMYNETILWDYVLVTIGKTSHKENSSCYNSLTKRKRIYIKSGFLQDLRN